jgi:protein TonB
MKKITQLFFVITIIALYSFRNQLFSQTRDEGYPTENIPVTDSTVFTVVEEIPRFVGGEEARINFFVKNMVYPEKALKKRVQGTVYVSFTVEKDGSISNVNILRGIGSGCDEEAIRVVKFMPKWIPARQRGKNVRVQFYLPLNFTLTEEPEKR